MSRAHSYAQVPVSETADIEEAGGDSTALALARSQKKASNNNNNNTSNANSSTSKGKQNDRHGYAALNQGDMDEEDEFEDAAEDSAMLKSMSAASSSSRSAPRRSVYTLNDGDDDDDNEISIAPPAQGSSSGASEFQTDPSASNATSTSQAAAANVKRNSGARTTNVSFLARLTGRQRPERDARRMIQSTIDGVFSNLSAKPRVEKPYEEELPPSYKTVAMDVSPAYYESTVLAPGFTDDDELLVDGLPVGGLFGFMWNMIISMSFRFVGFFLTYLLHTSHATKQGSKTGLGITFISIGYNMMYGRLPDDDDTSMEDEDSDTGYMGNTDSSSSIISTRWSEYMWLSYFLIFLGSVIMVQSLLAFAKAKRAEMVIIAQTSAALEATVPANAAAGLPAALASLLAESARAGASSGSGSTLTIVPMTTFSNTSNPRPGLDTDGDGSASGSRSSRSVIVAMV